MNALRFYDPLLLARLQEKMGVAGIAWNTIVLLVLEQAVKIAVVICTGISVGFWLGLSLFDGHLLAPAAASGYAAGKLLLLAPLVIEALKPDPPYRISELKNTPLGTRECYLEMFRWGRRKLCGRVFRLLLFVFAMSFAWNWGDLPSGKSIRIFTGFLLCLLASATLTKFMVFLWNKRRSPKNVSSLVWLIPAFLLLWELGTAGKNFGHSPAWFLGGIFDWLPQAKLLLWLNSGGPFPLVACVVCLGLACWPFIHLRRFWKFSPPVDELSFLQGPVPESDRFAGKELRAWHECEKISLRDTSRSEPCEPSSHIDIDAEAEAETEIFYFTPPKAFTEKDDLPASLEALLAKDSPEKLLVSRTPSQAAVLAGCFRRFYQGFLLPLIIVLSLWLGNWLTHFWPSFVPCGGLVCVGGCFALASWAGIFLLFSGSKHDFVQLNFHHIPALAQCLWIDLPIHPGTWYPLFLKEMLEFGWKRLLRNLIFLCGLGLGIWAVCWLASYEIYWFLFFGGAHTVAFAQLLGLAVTFSLVGRCHTPNNYLMSLTSQLKADNRPPKYRVCSFIDFALLALNFAGGYFVL